MTAATEPRPDGSLERGRTPMATPGAVPIAVLLALVLLVVGVVGARDGLVAAGALRGSSWTVAAARAIDGAAAQVWMVPVGVVLVLVGLWWLLVAIKPRRRTELEVDADVAVWLRPADAARLATFTADDVPGVLRASSTASRRAITITADTTAHDTTEVTQLISEAVASRLANLRRMPRIAVRARSTGGN